jgi:CRP-like cAMP-binding protein
MRKVLYIMGLLNDSDIEWMATAGRRQTLAPGHVLISQGIQVADIYIVLAGSVDVQVAGAGVIARRGSGEIIGEMSFVDKAPPSATVRVKEPTTVLALDKRTMEARLATDPGFAARFYKALATYLADRLRNPGGDATGSMQLDEIQADELDEAILDQISMAGLRFRQMIETLSGVRPSSESRNRQLGM